MSDASYLLDTSALLTLIEDESGAARVEEVLRTQSTIIMWMSLLEVAYITQQERGVVEAERRYALMKTLPVMLVWQMEESVLLAAARLKATHRLSLADTIIAAYAMQTNAILVHKDSEFEALAEQIGLETLPYKT